MQLLPSMQLLSPSSIDDCEPLICPISFHERTEGPAELTGSLEDLRVQVPAQWPSSLSVGRVLVR